MDEHDFLTLDSHAAEALTAQLLAASAAVDGDHGDDDNNRLVGLDAEQQRQLVQLAQEHHRHQLEEARQAQQQHDQSQDQFEQHQHQQHGGPDGYVNAVASTSQLPRLGHEPSTDGAAPPTANASPASSAATASLPFPSYHDEPHYLNFDCVAHAEAWLETQRVYARWGLKYFHRANNSRTEGAYKAEQSEKDGVPGSASVGNGPGSPSDLDVGGVMSASGSMLDDALSADQPSPAEPPPPASKKRARGGSSTAGAKRGPKVKWEWTKIFICNHAGKWPGSKAKDGKGKMEQSIKMGCGAKIYMRRRKDSAEVEIEYRWRHNHNPAAVAAAATAVAKAVAPPKAKSKKPSQNRRVARRQERERLANEQDDGQLDLQRQADALLPPIGDGGSGSLSSEMLSSLGVVPVEHGAPGSQHLGGTDGGDGADEMDLSGYVQQQELGDDDDDNNPLDPTLAHLTAFGDLQDHVDALHHRPVNGDPSSGVGGPYDVSLSSTEPSGHDPHAQPGAFPMPIETDASSAFHVLGEPHDPHQHQHQHQLHHLDDGGVSDDALLHATASTASAEAFYASLGAPVMASVLVSTIQDALALADRCKDEAERSPQTWDPLKLQAVSERFRAARDELERLMTNGGH